MQKSHGSQPSCSARGKTDCSSLKRQKDESPEELEERHKLQSRLCRIRDKIVVFSGRGRVGKSIASVNIAAALMAAAKRSTHHGIERQRFKGVLK